MPTSRQLLIALPVIIILAAQLTAAFFLNTWIGLAVVVMATLLSLTARKVATATAERRTHRS